MARKGHSQEERQKAVEAYARGEQVETLMRRHHVSRAAIYQWIGKAKIASAEQAIEAGKSPEQRSKDKLTDQSVRIMQLESQLEQTRKALLKLMVETGKL